MSTNDGPANVAADTARQDLEAAERAFQAAMRPRVTGNPPAPLDPTDPLAFAGQLSFLLTIGYLTKPQSDALFSWFLGHGTMKLPVLPGPDGISGPTMYEILSTRIHFGTPEGAEFDHSIFSALVQGIGDLVSTVTDGVTTVLQAGTGLIEAGTQLVHAINEVLSA